MRTKLFQITIKERKNDGTELKHFYVIKTNYLYGLINLFLDYRYKFYLGKHKKSKRSWSHSMTGGHIHIFEKGSIRIQPLIVDEDIWKGN